MKESSNVPKKVYLQYVDGIAEPDQDGDASIDRYWADEKIYDNDVVYLPAERVKEVLYNTFEKLTEGLNNARFPSTFHNENFEDWFNKEFDL